MPPGVINLVTGHAPTIGQVALDHPDLAGVHFTGSTGVFQWMWKTIGENIARYRTYPRLVGETGGKDFIVAHPSADARRAGGGDRARRLRVPGAEVLGRVAGLRARSRCGKKIERAAGRHGALAEDGRRRRLHATSWARSSTRRSFTKLKQACDGARNDPRLKLLAGGECDDKAGWFIRPTLVRSRRPEHRCMDEEIFGPRGDAVRLSRRRSTRTACDLCDSTSPYALTGAVFANDRARHPPRPPGAPARGRQLLHQRQAHRRGGRPAAVRRGPRVGHQRQGRLGAEPAALGLGRAPSRRPSSRRRTTRYPFMKEP